MHLHDGRELPSGSSSVSVSVIDTTTRLENCPGDMILDPCPPGVAKYAIPSYSFLIHHKPSDFRLLFDLGLRKNWQTRLSPHLMEELKPLKLKISCEKDVADILEENKVPVAGINAIVFSHHHWDHVGDTTRFPPSTRIVVGPGYKQKYLPGWPKDPNAADTTSDLYENRETCEISFEKGKDGATEIGGYRAYDWFGDGSFYLLDTPGHTTGHLAALARTAIDTTPDGQDDSSFILLGGDMTHHCALFRPSEGYPLPSEIVPSPFAKPFSQTSCCFTDRLLKLHPRSSAVGGSSLARTTPLARVPDTPLEEDFEETQRTIDKLAVLDSDPRILTIFAHDGTMLDIIDLFPKSADEWRAKGWGEQGHWRFLADLE